MSGPITGSAARGEALRADLSPTSQASQVLAHPDPGPAGAAGGGR
jgi:hypothetical protein